MAHTSTPQASPALTGNLASVKQIAKRLSVCPHALYRHVRDGHIPHYKFGRKVLLDFDEVRAALRVGPKPRGAQ